MAMTTRTGKLYSPLKTLGYFLAAEHATDFNHRFFLCFALVSIAYAIRSPLSLPYCFCKALRRVLFSGIPISSPVRLVLPVSWLLPPAGYRRAASALPSDRCVPTHANARP